ncbi:MAG: cytochrome B [Beggiatoa sp. IS2]|nr:MAG: cytochrome B [Beggiatoa sp. IS2]
MINKQLITWLCLFATLLTLIVVTLGAYVRLSNAGLGCPDWPGCYGHLIVPEETHEITTANSAYPDRPIEGHKAWKEMIHRYVASTLGLLIMLIALIAVQRRQKVKEQSVTLPVFLVFLVIFQALLGMWTVTLLLKPIVVTAHLLGGMLTLSLLWWLTLRQSGWFLVTSKWSIRDGGRAGAVERLRPSAMLTLLVVFIQIFLGGWTSANYAALACTDFPTCYGQWWPEGMDFTEAFILWRGIGVNYEYGVLSAEARTAIHVIHRVGALITFLLVIRLGLQVLFASLNASSIKMIAAFMLLFLLLQIGLGISNVVYSLPLSVAVTHNMVAALLLMTVVALNHALRPLVHL